VVLIDAGPLVALVKADDHHHAACATALKGVHQPLGTVWPVLTEVMYLLAEIPRAQDAVWEMILRGVIRILPLDAGDFPRIREVMRKYADRVVDLADAALTNSSC
jgi:predicted nucleic acid-binding protein